MRGAARADDMTKEIDFDFWKDLSTLSVWEVAAMMNGYDPNWLARGEIVVNDYGEAPDLSDDERKLISAALTGDVDAVGAGSENPDRATWIKVDSLVPWLRGRGYAELAERLQACLAGQAGHAAGESDPVRRLRRLREMGGTAEKGRTHSGWKFKKLGELVAVEAQEKRGRSTDKTIRDDLIKAIKAEEALKREGQRASPLPI